jgi:hypothetical protein
MVKGTHKQMVVVRTKDSRYYEQAYFVLRDGGVATPDSESTMVAEANRILDESQLMPQPRRRHLLSRRASFALGVAVGGVLCGLAALLLLL